MKQIEMTKEEQARKQFKEKVIEAIHGLSYEEAVKKEETEISLLHYRGLTPITIGRVMQAIISRLVKTVLCYGNTLEVGGEYYEWKLTKESGQECTDDDQTIETIVKLSELLE